MASGVDNEQLGSLRGHRLNPNCSEFERVRVWRIVEAEVLLLEADLKRRGAEVAERSSGEMLFVFRQLGTLIFTN